MHHELYVECRKRGERRASPTTAIIDRQSVKSAEMNGRPRTADFCDQRMTLGPESAETGLSVPPGEEPHWEHSQCGFPASASLSRRRWSRAMGTIAGALYHNRGVAPVGRR
jgi:hypothetical protein